MAPELLRGEPATRQSDGFSLGGQKVSLVAASNRKDNSIALYKVNPQTRHLENVAARSIRHGVAGYGMCLFRSEKSSKTYYFATSKSGDVENVGHYTQMIWRDTRQVGCATAVGQSEEFLVCRYSTAGNVYGERPA